MDKVSQMISCLLLIVGAVTAETDQNLSAERLLPQWLVGIIAVAVFLFLSFVALLVKKAWCEESNRTKSERESDLVLTNRNTYDTSLDTVRSKDVNVYDNLEIDSSDDKVTPM
ncbi:PDZK1-interacting protein 1 isoform X3 [Hippoglossus hippoglossus]|uniref:PDZK1-interacting protein 1 isoform X3 n=1 Tax=Hippoglossus hippoglossus TaxID=8267 RepID=UPI00148C7B19|nr:PDZK1-interacting protein 1 isoform X3 [Hippoglossus hippoglossus]